MAAEAIQNFMHLRPFGGNSDEDIEQFIAQATAAMAVQGVHVDNAVAYVMLRLKGGALSFFETLDPAAERDTWVHLQVALRNRYNSANRRMTNQIAFQERYWIEGKESIEDYLTAITKLAILAFANDERVPRVKEQFMRGLPAYLKRKALAMPEATTIAGIVEAMVRHIAINKCCPSGETPSAFNAVQPQWDDQQDDLAYGLSAMNKILKDMNARAKSQETELAEIRKDIKETERNVRNDYRARANSRDRNDGRYGSNHNPNYQQNQHNNNLNTPSNNQNSSSNNYNTPNYPRNQNQPQNQGNYKGKNFNPNYYKKFENQQQGQNGQQNQSSPNPNMNQDIKCFNCEGIGHYSNKCSSAKRQKPQARPNDSTQQGN